MELARTRPPLATQWRQSATLVPSRTKRVLPFLSSRLLVGSPAVALGTPSRICFAVGLSPACLCEGIARFTPLGLEDSRKTCLSQVRPWLSWSAWFLPGPSVFCGCLSEARVGHSGYGHPDGTIANCSGLGRSCSFFLFAVSLSLLQAPRTSHPSPYH